MKDDEFEKLKKKYRLSTTQDYSEDIGFTDDSSYSLQELMSKFKSFLEKYDLEDAQLNVRLDYGYYDDRPSLESYLFARVNKTRSQLVEEIKVLQDKEKELKKTQQQEYRKNKKNKEELEKKEYERLKKKYGE